MDRGGEAGLPSVKDRPAVATPLPVLGDHAPIRSLEPRQFSVDLLRGDLGQHNAGLAVSAGRGQAVTQARRWMRGEQGYLATDGELPKPRHALSHLRPGAFDALTPACGEFARAGPATDDGGHSR